MKKLIRFLILTYLFIPICVFAYSDYIIASGKNIGIELKSDNVIVVGAYVIDNHNNLIESELSLGDKILKLNDYDISSVEDLQNTINKINDNRVSITYKRNGNIYTTNLNLYSDDNEYKTGLYVRDTIRGVATLTYIDTESKIFDYLASGKPTLTTFPCKYNPAVYEGAGIEVKDSTPRAIAKTIDQLSMSDLTNYGKRAQEASEKYDYKALSMRLLEIIESVMKR